MRHVWFAAVVCGLAVFGGGKALAQGAYRLQTIFALGDEVGGGVATTQSGHLEVGVLNDRGHNVFVVSAADGGQALIDYIDGQLTPIVVPGQLLALEEWTKQVQIHGPVSMNQAGNVVFTASGALGSVTTAGTFLWDGTTHDVRSVALRGMPFQGNRTFQSGGGPVPMINNHDEIAFVAEVGNAAGEGALGVFFTGRDGKIIPVALPDQDLPGGRKLHDACFPCLSDTGLVAFLGRNVGEETFSAYLWEQGEIRPVAVVGQDLPGGGRLAAVDGVRLSNRDAGLFIVGRRSDDARDALYRFASGRLTPVLTPGQQMPGGGKFKDLFFFLYGISFGNEAGQYAILARLDDGSTSAYLIAPDGGLSLILKQGMATNLGEITHVGDVGTNPPSFGIGLNNQGQVALPVRINSGVPTVILLTPTRS